VDAGGKIHDPFAGTSTSTLPWGASNVRNENKMKRKLARVSVQQATQFRENRRPPKNDTSKDTLTGTLRFNHKEP
jgi:hypothetical protein